MDDSKKIPEANLRTLTGVESIPLGVSGGTTALRTTVNALITYLKGQMSGYTFAGVATPSTDPGTPDQKVYYLATEEGTYTNFGITIAEGEVAILKYDSSWSKDSIDIVKSSQLSEVLDSFGDVEAESLNISTPHKVCGFPAILYGAGAPSSSIIPINWDEETMGVWSGFPCFIGQLYINTSAGSGGLYYAVNTGAVTDWKNT